MTEVNSVRVVVILLFTIAFTLFGTFAPVIYASYVPESSIVEVQKFEAQNTTTQSEQHYICFERTVHRPATAKVFTELYLVDTNDNRVEVESRIANRYFQQGDEKVITPFTLPDNLQSGEYQYLLVAKMELADGRVTRDMTFRSSAFTITDGEARNISRPIDC